VSQAAALRDALAARGDSLRGVWGEGDSNDRTATILAEKARKRALTFDLIDVSHGGPKFGSVNVEQRWRQISYCCNAVLDAIPQSADVVVYVESDLIWSAETMIALMDRLGPGIDVVAPMSMAYGEDRPRFYDTWGHRSGGVRFEPYAPFHPAIAENTLTTLDSAGSCLVLKGHVAQTTRFTPPELGIVGWGDDINAQGYLFWLDPSTSVWHP
jgi:hypothetical protein